MKLGLKQDMRPYVKSPPLKFQSNKIGTEGLKTLIFVEVKTDKVKPTAGGLQQASTYTRKGGDKHGSVRAASEAKEYLDTRQLELSKADVKSKRKTENMKNELTDNEYELKEGKISSRDF